MTIPQIHTRRLNKNLDKELSIHHIKITIKFQTDNYPTNDERKTLSQHFMASRTRFIRGRIEKCPFLQNKRKKKFRT